MDLVSILISFFLAFFLRFIVFMEESYKYYIDSNDYFIYVVISLLAYFLLNEAYINRYNVFNFSTKRQFYECCKLSIFKLMVVLLVLNFFKINSSVSRIFELIDLILMSVICFTLRTVAKRYLFNVYENSGNVEKIIILSDDENMEYILNNSIKKNDWRNKIVGVIPVDGGNVQGQFSVIQNDENLSDNLQKMNYDSVIIALDNGEEIRYWLDYFQSNGKITHVYLKDYFDKGFRSFDSIGDLSVMTYRYMSPMPKKHQMIKRILDIILSLLLMPFFLVLLLIVKLFEPKEKIIIRRVRVGKNNIRYYQYRFRVFRIDAEERINNNLSPYSAIGRILVATHLDGAPQIINVLLGDMSITGPKAPNLVNYINMSVRERSMLTIKPGIIGYWSVKSDYEEINNDIQDYIENWNILKDISVVITAIVLFISGKSLRWHGDTHVQEELDFVKEQTRDQHVSYDENLYTVKQNTLYLLCKRVFDIVFSVICLIILGIPMIVIALLITIDDGGNPIYTQERIGKNGKIFNIYKFRSMVRNAGELNLLLTEEQLEQYKKEFKVDGDPRVTKLGSFIRLTSIDELPQLWNILTGDLSFVGPRPVVEEELFESYNDLEVAKFLSVKPGLTGYWQAYARNNAVYETGERQKMEMYYVDHHNLLMDIRILFKTVFTVLKKEGVQ